MSHYETWLKKILARAPRPKGWEFWDDLANQMSWNLNFEMRRRPAAFPNPKSFRAEFRMRRTLYEALRDGALDTLPRGLMSHALKLVAVKRHDTIQRRHRAVVCAIKDACS